MERTREQHSFTVEGSPPNGEAMLLQRVVAVVPALNEERSIGTVVSLALRHVDAVYVVDDGSSDRTATVAECAGAVCVRQANGGYGSAIQRGFEEALKAGADIVVVLDGDLQHDPDDIPKLVAPLMQGDADISIGNRYVADNVEVPAFRRLGQQLLSSLGRAGGAQGVSDSQNGYRAFTRRALVQTTALGNGMGFASDVLFSAKDRGLTVAEVPTCIQYFPMAKRSVIAHGIEVLDAILSAIGRRRPLVSFGLPGLALATLGVILGLRVLVAMAQSGTIMVGSAVLTAVLVLAGLLLSVTAVLLVTIGKVSDQVSADVTRRIYGGHYSRSNDN